jgi:GDP-4-dehydro-6-deoxy-D-mannose reductase
VVEATPFRPVTPYAASKAAAELLAIQAHLGAGLDVIRARPFNHTGPAQGPQFVVPALARQIVEAQLRGAEALETGNLDVHRDMADVRDVVRAYRLLLECGSPGQVYNVCTGQSRPIGQLARRLLELAGLDLELRVDPARARPVDVPDMRGDPSRLEAATGWRPAIDLDTTLSDVLGYWRGVAAEPASPRAAAQHPAGPGLPA